MKNEIILFENQNVKLEVNMQDETVWLNAEQMSELLDRDYKTIRKHIHNALQEELDSSVVAKFATVQKEGKFTLKDIMIILKVTNLQPLNASTRKLNFVLMAKQRK